MVIMVFLVSLLLILFIVTVLLKGGIVVITVFVVLVLAILFIVTSLLIGLMIWAPKWPQVKGEMISSDIVKYDANGRCYYHVHMKYAYELDHKRYCSRMVNLFIERAYPNRQEAELFISQLTANPYLTVFVCPLYKGLAYLNLEKRAIYLLCSMLLAILLLMAAYITLKS